MRLIVGSVALKVAFPSFPREPFDRDEVVSSREVKGLVEGFGGRVQSCLPSGTGTPGGKIHLKFRPPHVPTHVEMEVAWDGSTGADLLEECGRRWRGSRLDQPADALAWRRDDGVYIATPSTVLAMKMSHRFKADSVHFEKTRSDILWLRDQGVKMPKALVGWVAKREEETLRRRAPRLNQPSKDFFDPSIGVTYRYVHDTLHEAVKLGEQPAYRAFQADGEEVRVDRGKWDRLDDETRLRSVIEETCVLALERHQIPTGFRPDPFDSYRLALRRVCTNISSGWWREWAWEHFSDALEAFPSDYVTRFHQGLATGVVKPQEEGV